MKLPPFELVRPDDVDAVVSVLASRGPEAAVLAGGQSLLLEMRYGDVSPPVLVGLDRVPGLDLVEVGDDSVRVGALVTHASVGDLAHQPGSGALGRLTAVVAPEVAHPPIRARGTFAGSLAWAHPSAEWGALAVLTEAVVRVQGPAGERRVPAEEWFVGHRRTTRRPDEVVVAVDLPLPAPDAGVGFQELRRTSASFALVAVLAVVELDDSGAVARARVGVAGAGEVPLRPHEAEAALVGTPADDAAAAIGEAARLAAAAGEPVPEPHCSPDYRRHAVEVLTRRTLTQALADAVHRSEDRS